MAAERIRLEVAYALPDRQLILPLEADAGITVEQAIERSGILDAFPDIDLATQKIGIFGKVAAPGAVLADGDRVEIYRPLIADPKEARRKRASEGKELRNRAARSSADGTDEDGEG